MRFILLVFLAFFTLCSADSNDSNIIESSNAFLDSKVDFIESSLESNLESNLSSSQDSIAFNSHPIIESNIIESSFNTPQDSIESTIKLAAYNDFNSTQTPHKNYGPEGAFMPLDYGSPGDFELLDGKRKSNSNSQNSSSKGGGDNFVDESPFNTIDSNSGYGENSTDNSGSYGDSSLDSKSSNKSGNKGKGKLTLDSLSPIYFDFDRYNIRADMQEFIRANADFIKENNIAQVVLQGNTDEVGSDEYNMALGHKRALSVRDALVVYGLPRDMFSTISYGTHNPTCLEHTKECHAKNRRTEIVEKSEN